MISTALALVLAGLPAAAGSFQPGHVVVLRAGDGAVDLKLKQAPIFVDEFVPGAPNSAPANTVAIPTNGTDTLFFNGHAATEGVLARSADHRLLTVAGYGGVNLLQKQGTPSLLDIKRAFCTVDFAGTVYTTVYQLDAEDQKMNPRGVVTDGTNNFWGCGNALATLYFHPDSPPEVFDAISSTRALRIINQVLYTTLNGPDGIAADLSAGIFTFQDGAGDPAPLPRKADSKLKRVLTAQRPYVKIAGFDMNPEGTIAYTADTDAGIQKYVKTGGAWKFAYNFSIPQNIPASENHAKGCFGVVVDFSAPAPIIYATTTEGYGGSVNSNRVVQIVDTNPTAVVTTLAQSPSLQMVYRGIDFTPEAAPVKP